MANLITMKLSSIFWQHIREALSNSPIQTDQNTEEEVSSRTPYDNELLEQDEELDPMEAC